MAIDVLPWDARWPAWFAALEARLRDALHAVPVRAIEHVGSTAVPGLAAKPVIDIDIVVERVHVPAASAALERIGYVPRGQLGIPDRWAFGAPEGGIAHHCYVTVEGCLSLRNHLAVRDVLRADAALRDEYAATKLRLAATVVDIDDYIAGKSPILQRILERAGISEEDRRRIDGINAAVLVRAYRSGDAPALRRVFHSSVHVLARRDYDEAQRRAWAPDEYDEAQWLATMERLQPWVVEDGGVIVAYADLQPDGYIDHFFVAGSAGGRGIAGRLMTHLLRQAQARDIGEQYAHVSLSAQPLFARFGFVLEAEREVLTRGVTMRNALMRRKALPGTFD